MTDVQVISSSMNCPMNFEVNSHSDAGVCQYQSKLAIFLFAHFRVKLCRVMHTMIHNAAFINHVCLHYNEISRQN